MNYFSTASLMSLTLASTLLMGCGSTPTGTLSGSVASGTIQTTQTSSSDNTVVKNGNTVTVRYVGRLTDGTVFDTNIEQEAKKSGKYIEGRGYTPLEFVVGTRSMIAGFEAGVIGMKKGEKKTITIAPEQGYGAVLPERVISIPRKELPGSESIKVGDKLSDPTGMQYPVVEVTADTVRVDTNHELAGKTIVFDVTIESIK